MNNPISKRTCVKYHPIAAFILFSLANVSYAVPDNNTRVSVVNGVTIIDIKKANEQGISHNIYDKFNVEKKGMILNNSQNVVNTLLAGEVKGNSNLTSGAAKVILNEVTSKNQSALQGLMEVAGSKAHLIIANPNGISCQGCGFINAEKVTVTTGKPDMQNGILKGYSINGGGVTLTQLQSSSPTEILARSITVKGNIYAEELSMVAGNNYVDINGKPGGTVQAAGNRSHYGIDVAAIGGMYANKISLISSEKGVGVRNSGIIAGTADIQIDSGGKLVNNRGQMKSAGLISIKAQGGLDNLTGKISSENNIHINTHQKNIINDEAGNIAAVNNITIDSRAFNNNNGKISAGGTLKINTHNDTLTNTGKGDAVGMHAGVVMLQTGMLDNLGGLIKGGYVGVEADRVNNTHGTIEATSNMEINSKGNIENRQGLLRSTAGYVHLNAARGNVNNGSTRTADTFSEDSQGIIAGEGGIEIKAASLNSRTGQIASKGNITIVADAGVDNFQGKVSGDKNLYIKAGSLLNGQAGVSTTGDIRLEIANDFTNSVGIINSDAGDILLQAERVNNKGGLINGQDVIFNVKSTIDNSAALLVANKNLSLTTGGLLNNSDAQKFADMYGKYFSMPNQKGGMVGRESVTINAGKIDNAHSRIVAEFGNLNIKSNEYINNAYGKITAGSGLLLLNAQDINNDYAIVNSKGSLKINTASFSNLSTGDIINNNATGIISAANDLTLDIDGSFANYGWINSQGNGTVTVGKIFSNRNTVNADKQLKITAKNRLYNHKDIATNGQLIVNAGSDLKNKRGGNIQGAAAVVMDVKGELLNQGSIATNGQLTISVVKNLYNYNYLLSAGKVNISAKHIANSGSRAYLGGVNGLVLKAGIVVNSGTLIGL